MYYAIMSRALYTSHKESSATEQMKDNNYKVFSMMVKRNASYCNCLRKIGSNVSLNFVIFSKSPIKVLMNSVKQRVLPTKFESNQPK